jgi:hypothetical protein
MTKITDRFTVEAINAAPMGVTGDLKDGISGSTHQIGPKLVEGMISSSANHTLFVIHGTGFPVKGHAGRIWTTKGFETRDMNDAYVTLWGVQPRGGKFSRKGKGDKSGMGRRRQHRVRRRGYWLRLPFLSKSGGPLLLFSVRGQESNNFLLVAWSRTARNHSAIRRNRASFPAALR